MFMLSLLTWWYTRGWGDFIHSTGQRLANLADYFSIGLLFKTFFAPFRQISAETSSTASMDVRLRMALDRLISRVIGAFVRFFIIIAGLISIIFSLLFSAVIILIWPLVPLTPAIGLVLTISGVTIL